MNVTAESVHQFKWLLNDEIILALIILSSKIVINKKLDFVKN